MAKRLQLRKVLGFNHLELLHLNAICPNIEFLEIDFHNPSVKAARQEMLEALTTFRRLRHLGLHFHPKGGLADEEAKHTSRLVSGHTVCARGEELAGFFFGLSTHIRGSSLESFTYYSPGREICRLWEMGPGKVMLGWSNGSESTTATQVYEDPTVMLEINPENGRILTKELYEGTELLWTKPLTLKLDLPSLYTY
ncbi:MAG: hypothetical protein Q9223_004510 [Gallowayella weberi]